MSYEELEKEISKKIKDLLDKIKDEESRRDKVIEDRKAINSKIEDYKLQLSDLEDSKSDMLKYKYEILINIIAGIPSTMVFLIPFIIMKLISNDIGCIITGIAICPIASAIFNKVKDRLLKRHLERLSNNFEFQLLLEQIKSNEASKKEQESLYNEKSSEIAIINSNISTYSNDITNLRSFLNFVTSKINPKETTLTVTKTKEKEEQ